MGIESCCNLIFKRCKLQVDMLQHQDESLPAEQPEVIMMWELISFERTINCRRFSITPLLCCFEPQQASRLTGSTCLTQDISEVGCAAGKLLLPRDPITLLQFERGAQPFCLSPKQNIYGHFVSTSPCVQMF